MSEHYLVRSSNLSRGLYLTELEIKSKPQAEENHVPVNHVFCCDISYSMYGTLGSMRKQLKNRIPDLVHPDDTITIIVFSGKGETTVLKECVSVKSSVDLKHLNDAIDRFMKPIGCTCFLDPVVATREVISNNKNGGLWSFIFLSDGGNNDAPWPSVISELTRLSIDVANASIIEYGYWADSNKLSEMAEVLGGSKIFSRDFDSYEIEFETILKGKTEPRIDLTIDELKKSLVYQQFIELDESSDSIKVYSSQNRNFVSIPQSTKKLYCLTKEGFGNDLPIPVGAFYAMAYVTSDALRYEVTEKILSFIGDSKFIEMYCNAFGKQKLFDFKNTLLTAVFDETVRGEVNFNFKPNSGAYCVVDFLDDLMSGDNKVCMTHPDFNYNRIGAKAVAKVELTKEEKAKLKKAKTKLTVDKIKSEVDSRGVKMTYKDLYKGYKVSDLTWNEDRANLSALVQIPVILELPENQFGIKSIESFIFRNYTFIKDGILNITELPVILDDSTYSKFNKRGLIINDWFTKTEEGNHCLVSIESLPVVNKKRTKSVSSKVMTDLVVKLTQLKFDAKYLGYLKKKFNVTDKVELGNTSYYISPEQKDFFASLGITSRGYSPKTELDKSGDYYMALELKASVKGFSSIPKIEDIEKKVDAGKKLTPSEEYMKWRMRVIDATYLDVSKREAYLESIRSAFTKVSTEKRNVGEEVSKLKFALILSRKWFSDRKDGFEDNLDTKEWGDGTENVFNIEYKFTESKQYI